MALDFAHAAVYISDRSDWISGGISPNAVYERNYINIQAVVHHPVH